MCIVYFLLAPNVVPDNFELDPDYNMTYESARFRWDRVNETDEDIRGSLKGYKVTIYFWNYYYFVNHGSKQIQQL